MLIKSSLIDAVIQKRIDTIDDNTSYVWFADVGKLTSDPVWQIMKLDTSNGDLLVQYADSWNFTQVWDDKASLTYS